MTKDRKTFERMGESAGAMAGKAADFGLEVTGALFKSASEMLGGWWSSDEPKRAASSWDDRREQTCRQHYASASRGRSSTGGTGAGHGATSGRTTGGRHAGDGSPAVDARAEPKSAHAAMHADAKGFEGEARVGEREVKAGARMETSPSEDAAADGFERARPGYQLGYVARRNPDYRDRSFNEIEPELRRVWESRSGGGSGSTGSESSWPEVRGFVDFAYQQSDDERR